MLSVVDIDFKMLQSLNGCMKEKLILIDGNSLIHRAFHALPPFKTKAGELVNAVFGFYSILINVITKYKPDYVAVAFDVAKKTFRNDLYADYKATRVKAPQELYDQFGRVKEGLNVLGVPIFEKEGFEADDLIATIADKTHEHTHNGDIDVLILTGDKDTFQLVDDKTFIISPAKAGTDNLIYNTEAIWARYGLKPDQMIDFKALRGDPSDNIPGVHGIGEKTAIGLLQKYGTLEGIYENLGTINGAVHEKLEKGREDAIFSKKMVTLVHDVPVDFKIDDVRFKLDDFEKIMPLFETLEFRSLKERVMRLLPKKEVRDEQKQMSIF
jgi:DNA polymerase-1